MPSEFNAQFAPTQAQADAVVAHLVRIRFRQRGRRRRIAFAGYSRRHQAGNFVKSGVQHRSAKACTKKWHAGFDVNTSDAMVPAIRWGDTVLAIHGLQDCRSLAASNG